MKIINVYIERTFNLGNYESLKVGLEANLAETDLPLEVTAELERVAFQHYNNSLAAKKQTVTPPPAPEQTTAKTPAQIANENTTRREQEQKQPPIHAGQIQLAFTEDMANRLSFEVKGDYHIIKPKAFLGSELFFAVNKIIKDTLHGEYISAGKESHWRVKR